ncbi:MULTISPECIES: hypothetical protein [unclassified Microcoleus]|uniref:hypothetical protein n=1 Tax=unclassified Microcoleus TaxID=2642155 RepID=UPI002FD16AE3
MRQSVDDIAQAMIKLIFESDYRSQLPQLKVPTPILQAKHHQGVPVEARPEYAI